MANELTLTGKWSWTKNSTTTTLNMNNLSVTITGTNVIHHRVSVGTSEEAIDFGDVATGGYAFFVNRDATNFVSIRQATSASDLIRINAGEFALFRFDGDASAPFIIADTAACEVEYVISDD